jgi:hypothetical protein
VIECEQHVGTIATARSATASSSCQLDKLKELEEEQENHHWHL